jgi:hypothetical protein
VNGISDLRTNILSGLNSGGIITLSIPLAPNPLTDRWPPANRFQRPVVGFDAGAMMVPPLSRSADEASQKNSPPPPSPGA